MTAINGQRGKLVKKKKSKRPMSTNPNQAVGRGRPPIRADEIMSVEETKEEQDDPFP